MKTMSIKMVTTMAGPGGCYNAGQVRHDVPEDEAKGLIAAHAAIPHKEEPETADEKQPGKEDTSKGDGKGDQKPPTVPKQEFVKACEKFQADNGEPALAEILNNRNPAEVKADQRHGILAAIRDAEVRGEFEEAVNTFTEAYGEDILLTVLDDRQPEDIGAEDIPTAMAALHTYTEENPAEED